VVEVQGPDHRRNFRVELRIGGQPVATGEGHTIKLAQQEAARSALESADELTSTAVQRRIADQETALDRDRGIAGEEGLAHRLGEEHADPNTIYGDDQVSDSTAIHNRNELEDRQVESAATGVGLAANEELSTEPENEFEARSVTRDV